VFARSSVESMITLKSPREVDIMSRAGRIVAATLARIREILRAGVNRAEIDLCVLELPETRRRHAAIGDWGRDGGLRVHHGRRVVASQGIHVRARIRAGNEREGRPHSSVNIPRGQRRPQQETHDRLPRG